MTETVWTDWVVAAIVFVVVGAVMLWVAAKIQDVYQQIPKWERRNHPLLSEVVQKLGINFDDVPEEITAKRLPLINFRCAECTHVKECRLWLFGELSNTAFRNFCPNAADLEYLQCQRLVA